MAQLEGMLPPATGSKENNEYWWTIDPQSLVLVRITGICFVRFSSCSWQNMILHRCMLLYIQCLLARFAAVVFGSTSIVHRPGK